MSELENSVFIQSKQTICNSEIQSYIAEMLSELSKMAKENGLGQSATFIDVAQTVVLNGADSLMG